jgi:hypothetical protein
MMKNLIVLWNMVRSCILFVIISAVSVGCSQGYSKGDARNIPQINIEGCEYFHETNNGVFFLVHKGNCKNPIHCENRVDSSGVKK